MKTAKNYLKRLLGGLLVFAMILGNLIVPDTSAFAAVNYENSTIPKVSSFEEFNTISAMYTTRVSVSTSSKSEAELSYFKFSTDEESWVYLTGSMSENNHDGGTVHVNLYSDQNMTNPVGEYGWGYWEYTNSFTTILKKGTYYGRISAIHANYEKPFASNLNIIGVAIPVTTLIAPTVKLSSDKSKATVSFPNVLGDKVNNVQYRAGKVSSSYNTSKDYWKYRIFDSFYGKDDAYVLTAKDDKYSFTAKKNGYYTIRLVDTSGNYASRIVKVSGIVAVSGVKHGKTYKGSVTIKFASDISATLNKKSLKSGTKITKKGKHTLSLKDKAGNKRTIKFTIK